MKPLTQHEGLVVPLMRANIDTDAIMPKQFLKSIKRTGFGQFLFDEWRYLDKGEPGMDCAKRALNPDFSFNQKRYLGASILLTGENFGCGSSREHAPWGLAEYGFRVIIAPSFADIFFSNCTKNGLLPIRLSQETIDDLFKAVEKTPGYRLNIDLPNQTIHTPMHEIIPFEIESKIKTKLVEGLDDIATTLQDTDKIRSFEMKHRVDQPWLFDRMKR